jgi:hypothetical protein
MHCDQLPFGVHGKEGVDGSGPSEGSAKSPRIGWFAYVFSRSEGARGHGWSRYGAFASKTTFRSALKARGPACLARVASACARLGCGSHAL